MEGATLLAGEDVGRAEELRAMVSTSFDSLVDSIESCRYSSIDALKTKVIPRH
jgi:hypothetical protein